LPSIFIIPGAAKRHQRQTPISPQEATPIIPDTDYPPPSLAVLWVGWLAAAWVVLVVLVGLVVCVTLSFLLHASHRFVKPETGSHSARPASLKRSLLILSGDWPSERSPGSFRLSARL